VCTTAVPHCYAVVGSDTGDVNRDDIHRVETDVPINAMFSCVEVVACFYTKECIVFYTCGKFTK
jgi:hypothetical protein